MGLDAGRLQRLDQGQVEVQAGLVDGPGAVGQHARPRDGHAEVAHAQAAHQPDVGRVALVELIRLGA